MCPCIARKRWSFHASGVAVGPTFRISVMVCNEGEAVMVCNEGEGVRGCGPGDRAIAGVLAVGRVCRCRLPVGAVAFLFSWPRVLVHIVEGRQGLSDREKRYDDECGFAAAVHYLCEVHQHKVVTPTG